MSDDRDLEPDNGRAPSFADPMPQRGAVGTGSGYSGQEYDGRGQQEWREADRGQRVPPDGEARGSGSPAEEIDVDTPGSSADRDSGDRADSNGQENVEDRENVSTVTPEDYPEQQ